MSRELWENKSHPDKEGWTREKFISYYGFYSPRGGRFHSIVKVNEDINIIIANVPDTKVKITINKNGRTHIRWLDIH